MTNGGNNMPEPTAWFPGRGVSEAVLVCGTLSLFNFSEATGALGGLSSTLELSEANLVANSIISVALSGGKASNTNIFPA